MKINAPTPAKIISRSVSRQLIFVVSSRHGSEAHRLTVEFHTLPNFNLELQRTRLTPVEAFFDANDIAQWFKLSILFTELVLNLFVAKVRRVAPMFTSRWHKKGGQISEGLRIETLDNTKALDYRAPATCSSHAVASLAALNPRIKVATFGSLSGSCSLLISFSANVQHVENSLRYGGPTCRTLTPSIPQ